MRSAADLNGVAADTARIDGFWPTIEIGANAAIASYGILGLVAATVRKVDDVSSSIEPSRGPFATASAPIVPDAPGRFSTMTDASTRLPSGGARARAMASLLAPAENGTTMRISLGVSCADAAQAPAAQATTSIRRMKPSTCNSPFDSIYFILYHCETFFSYD